VSYPLVGLVNILVFNIVSCYHFWWNAYLSLPPYFLFILFHFLFWMMGVSPSISITFLKNVSVVYPVCGVFFKCVCSETPVLQRVCSRCSGLKYWRVLSVLFHPLLTLPPHWRPFVPPSYGSPVCGISQSAFSAVFLAEFIFQLYSLVTCPSIFEVLSLGRGHVSGSSPTIGIDVVM